MIVIEGIDMPKECYRCPLLDGEYGTCNIIGETKVDMTKERAKNCPLIEIQEQKTGHWILADEQNKEDVENDNYRFICSECQCSDIHAKGTIVPYCWKCGAKMTESEE